jgi:cell division septal protein FtsQ
MPVPAPADRRFRRKQVSPRRRALRTPWRGAAIAGAIVASVAVAAYGTAVAIARSGWMAVTTISVTGNARISTGEVHALLDGLAGSNLLFVDVGEWRRKLMASPWVADVSMRRVFPGTIAVSLTEHNAIAIGRIDGVLHLINEGGDPIDQYGPQYAALDLPIVDGLTSRSGDGFLLDGKRAALAARLFAELRDQTLAARISQVDVTDPESVAVVLDGDTAILRLGDERFAERLQSYLDIAPRLRERVPEIDYVDLRYGPRVVVKPQPGRARPEKG